MIFAVAALTFKIVVSRPTILLSACTPSDITGSEARKLVLDAAATEINKKYQIDTELDQNATGLDADTHAHLAWSFRVFTTNPDPGTSSNLVGWFSVDKHTAAMWDPVASVDKTVPIDIAGVAMEQARLRAVHCQP